MPIKEQLLRRTEPQTEAPSRISRSWALKLGIAWAVLFPLGIALEPTPTVGASEPWWATIASLALLTGLIGTVVGLSKRMRWGVTASLAASSLFAAGVFACPTTGHHAFGLWWIGEFAASLALLAVSGVAYLRARPE